jgi:hypothetical protein
VVPPNITRALQSHPDLTEADSAIIGVLVAERLTSGINYRVD